MLGANQKKEVSKHLSTSRTGAKGVNIKLGDMKEADETFEQY